MATPETPANTVVVEDPAVSAPPKKKSKIFPIVLAILVIAGAIFGFSKYRHSQQHETTDDAQIEANVVPVISKIPGYISDVRVKDNQFVHKGDTLIVLDQRDLQLVLEQAEAGLQTARAGVASARALTDAARQGINTSNAGVATANAQIEAARVNVWRSNQDFKRYQNLIKDHSITQQQYEQALAAKQTAERQLQVLESQRTAAQAQTSVVNSQSTATGQQIGVAAAQVHQREVDVENARLNLSYTVITAPESGYVSKITLQPGQFIQAGASLITVVPDNNIWVVANFKETQLERMVEGQQVAVGVDAFPDREFEGRISSISPLTGSRNAILPPDNASGNFVKVVQRIPVRIDFNNPKDADLKKLRPGMNVDVDVHLTRK
jgi:membrane fusion protein (multidrug efflux system)